MRNQIIFFLILSTICGYSQMDTLNKCNDKKKKTGYWVEYFDNNVIPTDSANSYFYGFQLYDNGYKVYSFGKLKEKRKLTLIYDSILPKKGHPILVNGVFKWYFKDSTLRLEEKYVAGLPSIYKVYAQRYLTDKSTIVGELADFTRKYNNIQGTFYHELNFLYSDSKIQSRYYKDGKKWKSHRIK
jgi:hypothetical protein